MTQKEWDNLSPREKEHELMIPFFEFLQNYADKNYVSQAEYRTFRELHEQAAIKRQEIFEIKIENLSDRVEATRKDLTEKFDVLNDNVTAFMKNCSGPQHRRILDSYKTWLVMLSVSVAIIFSLFGVGDFVLKMMSHVK